MARWDADATEVT